MQSWGLPQGRPFAFAPPFASENADTISVLQQLGYHTSIRNSGDCLSSASMDNFCKSVSLCARMRAATRCKDQAAFCSRRRLRSSAPPSTAELPAKEEDAVLDEWAGLHDAVLGYRRTGNHPAGRNAYRFPITRRGPYCRQPRAAKHFFAMASSSTSSA
jgi:hypothetical protein